jgi:hypothetical protein
VPITVAMAVLGCLIVERNGIDIQLYKAKPSSPDPTEITTVREAEAAEAVDQVDPQGAVKEAEARAFEENSVATDK